MTDGCPLLLPAPQECEKEEKAYQAAMAALTKLEGMEREVEAEEAAYLARAPLVEAAKQRVEQAEKDYKETTKKITAVDKTINDLKAQMEREAEAAAARKAIMLEAEEVRGQGGSGGWNAAFAASAAASRWTSMTAAVPRSRSMAAQRMGCSFTADGGPLAHRALCGFQHIKHAS
jgi:pyruvate dehydrogenase complex dehydrogenase (E1) component